MGLQQVFAKNPNLIYFKYMKFLTSFLIVLMGAWIAFGSAQAQGTANEESRSTYNVPTKKSSTSSGSRAIYSSKAQTNAGRGSKGTPYTSKSGSSGSNSQPLSISNILSGNHQPKRVIAGFNDRAENGIAYSAVKERASNGRYTQAELAQRRTEQSERAERLREQAKLSYEERVAQRLALLKERQAANVRNAQTLNDVTALNASATTLGGTVVEDDIRDGQGRKQVYRAQPLVDTPGRLFNTVR